MMIQDTIYFKVAFVIPGGNHAAIRILNGKQGSTGIGKGLLDSHMEWRTVRLFSNGEDVTAKADDGTFHPFT